MSRPLLAFLLRRHRWTCGICMVLPVMLGVFMGLIFPMFEKERKTIGPFMDLMRTWFPDLPDFLSPAGSFIWPFMHPMTLLVLALAPAIPALAQPAGERGRGSLDLLLATQLSRTSLVGHVFAFCIPVALLAGLAPFMGSMVGALLSGQLGEIPAGNYIVASAQAAAMSLFFGSVALLISVLARDRGQATMIYVAMTIGFFLIDLVATMWKGAGWFSRCGPFGYYHPLMLARGEDVNLLRDLAVLIGGAVVLLAFSVRQAEKRPSA